MSRRFNHRFACASHSSLLDASRRRVHRLAPFSLASGIDDWSLPWRECCSSSHLEGWELRASLSQQLSMQIICTAARPLIAQFRTNESHFSLMSISFSQGKLSSEQRRDVVHFVQEQVKLAALEAIRTVIQECLEAEVTAKLGREKGAPRKVGQVRELDWSCGNCGCKDANQFTRDGHYHRDERSRLGTRPQSESSDGGMSDVSSRCDLSFCRF